MTQLENDVLLDVKLSKYLATRICDLRTKRNILATQDVMLISQTCYAKYEDDWSYMRYNRAGIIRFSPKGIMLYGTSHGEMRSVGYATKEETQSPFFSDLRIYFRKDTQNILNLSNDSFERYGPFRFRRLYKSGNLQYTSQDLGERKNLISFISRYLPSVTPLNDRFSLGDGNFPKSDVWEKLTAIQKKDLVERLAKRLDDAFTSPTLGHETRLIITD